MRSTKISETCLAGNTGWGAVTRKLLRVKSTRARDRYFDALRAAAIVRVVLLHTFWSYILQATFPSMGLMFAIGGSLTAASADRSPRRAILTRLRRLLPALWVFGLVIVPLMFLLGWSNDLQWPTQAPAWPNMLFWAFPAGLPPYSDLGQRLGLEVLWYLNTYLWLVLLTPLLLRLYRKWPLPTVLLPLVGLLLIVGWRDSISHYPTYWHLQNLLSYGTCWMLGIAHRAGDLGKLRPAVVIGVGTAAIGGALTWAIMHPVDGVFLLAAHPVAFSIFQIGFVLLLFRWSPPMGWLARCRPLDGFVSMINNRAVSIYLWHMPAIAVGVYVVDPSIVTLKRPDDLLSCLIVLAIALPLLALAVLAFGWVEDLSARRPPRISPFVKRGAVRQPDSGPTDPTLTSRLGAT
ncbi:acyltransferase [Actinoplanes sp. NPDC051859]|uniref:acyltransferase n=1 Tax=Actinoplanes sp. NPDC051859 TaxID=3363909 RepID=UPI00378D2AF5